MLTRKKALVNDKTTDKEEKAGVHDVEATLSAGSAAQSHALLQAVSISEQTKRSPASQKRPLVDGGGCRQRTKRPRRDTAAPNKQWEVWTDDDKDVFFQALQEFGKDFDKIHKYIVQKLKNRADTENKTRDQVRHFYYRTWRWLEKYVQFGDGVDKAAAELFGLINYSELRKKLGTKNGMNRKNAEKLRELMHCGSTAVKVCGKKIRLKTPTCPALKKLFKITDDKIVRDKVKVPEYVFVDFQPRDNYAWTYVHMMAHNPHVRVKVKSKQTLSQLLEFMQKKWVPHRVRLKEQYKEIEAAQELRVFPPSSVKLKEYILKASKPCTAKKVELNVDSYLSTIVGKVKAELLVSEQPLVNAAADESDAVPSGKTVPGTLNTDNLASAVGASCAPLFGHSTIDSQNGAVTSNRTAAVKLSDAAVASGLATQAQAERIPLCSTAAVVMDRSCNQTNLGLVPSMGDSEWALSHSNTLLNHGSSEGLTMEQIKELARNGWTVKSCDCMTVGELYMLIGSSEKVSLEYTWQAPALATCRLPCPEDLLPSKAVVPPLRKLAQVARCENMDLARKLNMSPSATKDTCSPSTKHKGRGVRSTPAAPAASVAPAAVLHGAPIRSGMALDALPTSHSQTMVPAVSSGMAADSGVFRIPIGPGMLRPESMSARQVSINSLTRVPMVTNRNVRNKIVRKPLLVQRTILPSSQAVFCVMPAVSPNMVPSATAPHVAAHRPSETGDVLSAAMLASGVMQLAGNGIAACSVSSGNVAPCQKVVTDIDAGASRLDTVVASTGASMIQEHTSMVSSPTSSGGHERRRITPVPVVANTNNLELTPFAMAIGNQPPTGITPSPLTPADATALPARKVSHNNPHDMDISNSGSALFFHEPPVLLGAGTDNSTALSFTGLIGSQVKPAEEVGLSYPKPYQGTHAVPPAAKEWLTADVSLGDFSLSSLLTSAGEKSPEKPIFETNIAQSVAALDDASRMSFLSKFDVTDMTVDNALNNLMSESSVDYISKFEDLASHISLDTPHKRLNDSN